VARRPVRSHLRGTRLCFIGNSDNDVPTKAAFDAIASVHDEHARRYGTPVLRSHRDVNQTGCPGAHLAAWVAAPTPAPSEEFTVDAEARKAFDDIIRRLDSDHLPVARDTNAWVKAKAAGAPADLAAAIAALGSDVARKVADELAKRLAS
jgi:hypothetical protein